MPELGIHPSLRDRSDVLSDRLWSALGSCVGVLLLAVVLTTIYSVAAGEGPNEVSPAVAFSISGTSLIAVGGSLWLWLGPAERSAGFPLRRPSTAELAWTVAFFPLGIGAFVAGLEVASLFGFEYAEFGYELTDPATLIAVVFGLILVAPVLEEALYRGVLIGALVGRGWSPIAAGIASILLFGVLHLHLGVAGAIAIAAWTVFPTILRLRFDNLAGPIVLHALNNLYAYVLAFAFPALAL